MWFLTLEQQAYIAKRITRSLMIAERKRLESASVANVLGQGGIELKPHEKASLEKVRIALEKGQNPYNHARMSENGKNLSGPLERVIDYKALAERDANEVAALEKKWQARHDTLSPGATIVPGLNLISPAFAAKHADPINKVCTLCGSPVSPERLTEGTGKAQRVSKLELVEDSTGVIGFEEKVFYRPTKAIACPECCLQLKTTKFRETEG